jgi:ganglioside GM2 activator
MKITVILLITLSFSRDIVAQYDIVLQALEVIVPNDKKFINFDEVKMKRFGRNQPHVLIGEFEAFKSLGNDTEFLAELYKKQGQEYRKTPYKLKGKLCEVANTEGNIFADQLWKFSDLPPRESCPFPAGKYHVKKLDISNLEGLPPVLESGDYMVEIKFYDQKGGKMMQGFRIYVTVVVKLMMMSIG